MKKLVVYFALAPLATALPALAGSEIEELQKLLSYHERAAQRHSDRLSDLSEEIKGLKGELEQIEASSAPYKEAIEAKRRIEAALPEMKPILSELEIHVGRLDAVLEGYKRAFVRKDVAPGTPLGNLMTVSGQSYTNAYVQSVGSDTIQIQHVSGVANLLIDDLPESVRSEFSREPRPSHMELDYLAIRSKKPRFLMSSEEFTALNKLRQAKEQDEVDAVYALRRQELADKKLEAEQRRQESERRWQAEEERRQAEEERRQAEEEARRQRDRELEVLYRQREDLNDQLQRVYSAKSSISTGSSNVRRSAVDIARDRQKYDAAANQINLQIREIDRRISDVRSGR